MKVVLADVEAPVLDATVADAAGRRARRDRRASPTWATSRRSRRCATPRSTPTAPSTCCATTPASARAPRAGCGTTRSTTGAGRSDVNVWGVIHGIKAFVPTMLEGGDEGHVVNTSSGNGGIAPLPGTPDLRADQVRGGHPHRVALRAARRGGCPGRRVGAVPGAAHAAHRPVRVVAQPTARAGQRDAARDATAPRSSRSRSAWPTPASTLDYTPVEEVADRVVDGRPSPAPSGSCRPSERSDEQITRPRRRRCSNVRTRPTSRICLERTR